MTNLNKILDIIILALLLGNIIRAILYVSIGEDIEAYKYAFIALTQGIIIELLKKHGRWTLWN